MNIFALNRNELKSRKKSNNKSNKRNKKLEINRIDKN